MSQISNRKIAPKILRDPDLPEAMALLICFRALNILGFDQRVRTLRWLCDRLGIAKLDLYQGRTEGAYK